MDEKIREENIMPGQMCYDELEPVNQMQEEKIENELKGQISLNELSGNNINEGSEKLDNKINDEKNSEVIIKNVKNELEESILDEIENDRVSRKKSKGVKNQIKFDLNSSDGGNIIYSTLEEVLHNSMIPYTECVVLDRALPRVEDGLKPVQRRILYTMLELGLEPDKPFRKSARIVGDCMGKYHPHGDSSVYDAMVRMAQDFSLREPLVLGHGNFGSIDGDSAAAMRYTEAKLTPLAMELLKDLEKNTVRWNLNFDDTLKEPAMLPGRFPNLLVNGASGIAVGVATNIPPHNLTEVIDGVITYINNPKVTLEEMMKIIKGPDFPTGGIVFIGNGLEEAYKTGKGKVIIRSKIHLEEKSDKRYLVITEIPYQTNKALLLQKIAEIRENNKGILSNILEIRDESDRKGMRAIIRIKKEANEKAILDSLYKQTGLETSFGLNMVAIAGGKPRLMGLLEIISYYTEYQREIVYRRTKFELDQAKERAHILEGLLVSIKNIDEVIKIIKSSTSVSDAKLRLRTRFELSERQAQAILDMRLARLVNLEVNKLIEELKQLKEKIIQLTKIYESKKLQLEVVKIELNEIKRKYKSNRKSVIDKNKIIRAKASNKKEKIEVIESETILALTAEKTIKSIPIKNFNLAQKELVNENTTLSHVHTQLLNTKNTQKVLIFTDKGNCYKTLADKIPELKWKDKGTQLKTIDKKIPIEDNPIKILEMPQNLEQDIIFYTASGMIKRSKLSDYNIAKSFFQAIKLKDGDEVVNVEFYEEKGSVLLVSKSAMVLNFEKSEIPTQGRVAGGVKGIVIDEEDKVIYGTQITESGKLSVITNGGFAKAIPVAEFGLSSRARKGLRAISLAGKSKELIYANFTNKKEYIALKFEDKIKLLDKIETDSRLGEGEKLSSDKIISASPYCF